jgi:NAD(P)-dependent dehydrogenase (short-subunit alcohol dehydrogenase family)
MAGLVKLWKAKHNPPADPTSSFTGKTIIITGANTGLGYEAAIKFTRLHASKLILGVRDLQKGQTAKSSIEKLFPGHKGEIEVWSLDMASYPSIKAFVEKVNALNRIDIVVLNAGVVQKDFSQSQYGWETTFQINSLSTTLLALLLLPKLKSHKEIYKQAPVLEFVSSGFYRNVTIPTEFENAPMEAYNQPQNFVGQKQYARSKFFLQCAIKSIDKLAGRPEDPDVIVTSVCPGACKSDLGRAYTNPMIKFILFLVQLLLFRTSEQGARSLVSGALIKAGDEHGGFWKDDKFQE